MLAFLLLLAMEENKAEGKQAEDEGIFFRFRDDGAVDGDPHPAKRRKKRTLTIVSSRKEVANGFVDQAGAHPSRSIPAGIRQSASRNTNP